MNAQSLEERLALLQVEPNDAGRLGAHALVAQLPTGQKRHRVRGWLLAGGAAALLVLTPPGQSFAEKVGDIVGIGGEPTGGPQFGNPGETRDDSVIATGTAPSGEPFELVATDPARPAPGPGPEIDATCVYTNFPESQPQTNTAQCLNAGVLRRLAERGTKVDPIAAVLPGDGGSPDTLLIDAYATSDVASLGLVVDGEETPMTTGVLQPVQDGARVEVRYGAGFVPEDALDYARLQQLAPDLDGPSEEVGALHDEDSPELAEAAALLGGIEVVGYGSDGSEIYRRAVIESPSDAFGVLMSFALESQRLKDGLPTK